MDPAASLSSARVDPHPLVRHHVVAFLMNIDSISAISNYNVAGVETWLFDMFWRLGSVDRIDPSNQNVTGVDTCMYLIINAF